MPRKKKPRVGLSVPESCFCKEPCQPLAQIVSHEKTHITVCRRLTNDGTDRDKIDFFRVEFKNDLIHSVEFWDKHDMIDTIAALTQAFCVNDNMERSGFLEDLATPTEKEIT